ncbi:MAG TPA: DUF2065 domain-containing protein [Deltaproteobacteria bacterium]|nr:MAG: hypothetical protein A2Z79_02415 [Deltaproteobacteria bacterium GWA2_55_82]OGQ62669.1 MAG: hypothetical protein A3I81_09235 [Deltaproteobacteria bacterium RIFCSPLOWO2_02_FULL_55_12]OIJ74261.1 MAG: hypothetical protein A2V21_308315 [Deltaproteobacteria bacterium GWC2_55_46]HBG46894.1 DUF2065 domain-containing protein [Deltaproteobacteria bacterium]HCY11048.1 DUF2065 domain-containing protein [Deltaproteobacteria bacterium]
MEIILPVLGALLVIEGLPYLLFPGKVKEWSAALVEATEPGMRVIGLVTVFAGLLILYLVRSF